MHDRSRVSKVRNNRSKARRSPYPNMGESSEFVNNEFSERPLDYTPDVSVPTAVQGYQGVMYSHEGMDRYSTLYPSPYTHPGMSMYRDAACVYPYQPPQRYYNDRSPFRGTYDDLYYPTRENPAYSGYVASRSTLESAKLSQSDSSRESYRQSEISHNASGGSQFDFRTSGKCSRSSSRDASYNTPHNYSAPYSNRSESSASEVDVVNEEYDKRHPQRNDRQNAKFDSLIEATQQLVKEESYKPGTDQSNGHLQRDSSQQSVIIRRQSNTSYQNDHGRSSNSASDYAPSAFIKSPSVVSGTPLHTEPKSNNTAATESSQSISLSTVQSSNASATQKLIEMRTLQEKSISAAQDAYTTCLKSACGYDAFGQPTPYQPAAAQTQRPYPVIPQAGYTSVIVDAQQYHMANGYVH